MDGIIEMIYALDAVAPGTANDDTLLYGVEVKFYNMEVDIDENLETKHKGLYVIGGWQWCNTFRFRMLRQAACMWQTIL